MNRNTNSKLTAHRLSFQYGGNAGAYAVRNVSFSVNKGQILAIIGESGSGKSTLLRLIYGLLGPSSGEVHFNNQPVPDPSTVLIPGHPQMRMVSQAFDDLNTYATVWDNVSSQLSNDNLVIKRRETRRLLKSLRLTELKDHRVFDLSGGEKQRVAIAVALINRPHVLLLDEPFNQVDASFREMLQEDILAIVAETKLTVILVSHDPTEVLALADTLLILRKGRKVACDTPKELFFRPTDPYVAKLLAQANIVPAHLTGLLGIPSNVPIGIHRNGLKAWADPQGTFTIQGSRFKGHYYEIILTHGELELRMISTEHPALSEIHTPGTRVQLEVMDFWSIT